MRILFGLTYYRPHYSGLTIYTERLAKALVRNGHQVTVLTSRFNPNLAGREVQDGVEIIRPKVMARVSKGVLMPGLPLAALRLARQADIVHLHLPQLDAALVSAFARLMGKPVVLTYHCDLRLPPGFIHAAANQVSHLANHISARLAQVIVTNTRDYAEYSPFLKSYLHKVRVIPPPVELPVPSTADLDAFCQKHQILPNQCIIGMAARLATEKGVEYLLEALPAVIERYPNIRVLFVGQYQDVMGEEQYAAKLAPLIEKLGNHWSFLGVIPQVELAAFFRSCCVTVLPSINGTESFGMVQVESMMSGTPVVAADLPGVRHPVMSTGMGKVVPARDSRALAQALLEVLDQPERFHGNATQISRRYASETVAEAYESVYRDLIGSHGVN
jgi:glycosyltransferase involved in cell wall biosynthesis